MTHTPFVTSIHEIRKSARLLEEERLRQLRTDAELVTLRAEVMRLRLECVTLYGKLKAHEPKENA